MMDTATAYLKLLYLERKRNYSYLCLYNRWLGQDSNPVPPACMYRKLPSVPNRRGSVSIPKNSAWYLH